MLARKLEYLIALAKEEHFARAAASCNVSQPALSAGIHQLEQELGVQIVKRGQKYQGLTEQGEVILAWAQRMEVECRRLHQELRDNSGLLSGTLRIGVLNSAAWFTSLFTIPFNQRFPEISLRVMHGPPVELQQGLDDLIFDVVITFLDESASRYLKSHPLYQQEYYVVTAKHGPLAGRSKIRWEELKKERLCLFAAEMQIFAPTVFQSLGPPSRGVQRIETSNVFILFDHVRTGDWATVLPKPILFMIAGSDEFEAIPLPVTSDSGWIGIGVPNRGARSPLAEAFFDIATSEPVLDRFQEFLTPKHPPSEDRSRMAPLRVSTELRQGE